MADEGPYRVALPWALRAPSLGDHYLVYCRAYAAATGLRLTLPDAMEEAWLPVALLHWIGAVLVAVNGCFLGWLACATGALLPILLLEDQLSQSAYLAACALVMVVSLPARRRPQAAIRWLTAAVYLFAAVHKLNRDYFDPAVSCANEGLRVVAERSPGVFSQSVTAAFDSGAWPVVHIIVELSIVVLLLRRARLGVTLAALMHIPLTIIFAPGFAFTMMSGWVCFFSREELAELWRMTKRRGLLILLLGGIPATLRSAFLFPGRWSSDPDWCIKEVCLWLVAAALCLAIRQPATQQRFGWPTRFAGVVVGAFIANGFTPYLGAQFHHTGAMLSNLRIDAGCHNSLLFPEALRGPHDPYVRLDVIAFAPQRADIATRAANAERLWSLRSLYLARSHWCPIHKEPLPAWGTYRGEPFATDDLCKHWPLPLPSLTGFRRFQVNLDRTCPQRCLH